jgi:hypothetical protein
MCKKYAVGKMIGYCFLALGFYISFQMAHIDLSSLAIIAGAVGVGLGFGLQNIISNFVSGLIILAERPITIGDRVEISGVAGQVKKISLRSTTVVTNDNIAIIVPNSKFITENVLNWSLTGKDDVGIRQPHPLVSQLLRVEDVEGLEDADQVRDAGEFVGRTHARGVPLHLVERAIGDATEQLSRDVVAHLPAVHDREEAA